MKFIKDIKKDIFYLHYLKIRGIFITPLSYFIPSDDFIFLIRKYYSVKKDKKINISLYIPNSYKCNKSFK